VPTVTHLTRISARRPARALLALGLALGACAPAAPGSSPAPATPSTPAAVLTAATPPAVQREFRGVWVASVANIDWPSRRGMPADSQRMELIALLDRAASMRLNAVILQVRPAGDALYASALEPWSEYLTGEQGKAPAPLYDPLEFAVTEAHRRGIELHAWFNPYRARHPSALSPVSATHLSRRRPELVKAYGRHLWMDPGEADVQNHTVAVVLDVVRRYDVDGVHLDDYFYPYSENDSAGRAIPFPDDVSWRRYVDGGGRLSRDDWRRNNVDRLVERLHNEIPRVKPWVKFGISPFGIWRPGYPAQIRVAFDPYSGLFADSRKWLREGWLDYFTPQLYWPIAQTNLSYPVLLNWWIGENVHNRHMWPGNFSSRILTSERNRWMPSELLGQVYVTRGRPGATGNVHFSMKVFMQNPDSLVEKMTNEAYAEHALIPATPWLGGATPRRPAASLEASGSGGGMVRMEAAGGAAPTWWVVQSRYGDRWRTEVLPGGARTHAVPAGPAEQPLRAVAVSAVERLGRQSEPLILTVP